jgi:hypothetical protein
MVLGVAVGDGNGVFIRVRNVVAAERKAGCVEMIKAQVDAFVSTDGQGKLLKQQVAAISIDRIECPAKLNPTTTPTLTC